METKCEGQGEDRRGGRGEERERSSELGEMLSSG